ncbi:dTDP-4-dehydrorhamnose reductase [Methanobrevibacter sp. OttesenSCG-928-K11]|nr:dTDP-4-dehydrorhamnose reductase [Methanobrevibacter sp. OttesenSCG-928-K11]MDL2270394.1 dTDP-4-dehydrorhamnose reductase [Methanobrevibacter sp. OttesenSCG-928-I08]
MKILITGADGMLGTDVQEVLKDEEIISTDVDTLDITNKEQTIETIKNLNPDIVINTAAFTDVDGCESNKDLAFKINAIGPENLAIACKEIDSPLLHISTDYIFNGQNDKPWVETDKTGPISVYGETKLQGELAIEKNLDKFFIIRTAWLYGLNGPSFPKTMLELAKNNNEISVVDDQVGSPTYTKDLALAISQLIKTDLYGIYHITNSDYCSWYDYAKLIFKLKNIDVDVKPVTTEEFPRPAPRPKFSVLANTNWEKNFKPLRSYKDAIAEFLNFLK